MKDIQEILDKMEPEEALEQIVPPIKKIISYLDDEAKVKFVTELMGGSDKDKITSMVNL
jgi:hypothetical protein